MEYSHKRRQNNTSSRFSNEKTAVNSGAQDPAYQAYLQSVLAGKAQADSKTMGHRQDLAPSLAAKMSKAFGMDLSQVKLYRSCAMEGTETKGMASGNNIVLSKDIDLNTMAGQAVLGHEISHVRAQSQGIGMGHSGLYQNAELEHQADVEGMMAARGRNILEESTGMDMGLGMGSIGGLTPLGSGMSASAGAPMQAKGKGKKNNEPIAKTQNTAATKQKQAKIQKNQSWEDVVNAAPWKNGDEDLSYAEWKKNKPAGKDTFEAFILDANYSHSTDRKLQFNSDMEKKYKKEDSDSNQHLGDAYKDRVMTEIGKTNLIDNASEEELEKLIQNMYANTKEGDNTAKLMLKELMYQNLVKRRENYGILPSQLDFNDLKNRTGFKGFASNYNSVSQFIDANKNILNNKSENMKLEGNKEDDYQTILSYYEQLKIVHGFEEFVPIDILETNEDYIKEKAKLKKIEKKMMGSKKCPNLNKKQLDMYKKSSATNG